MATQGGLKHVATEPSHLDKKRTVRRRGVGPGVGVGAVSATSRTAALRRAPSDSDCSGETASLSADSNERLRPAPPPPRANKTRSRRRGSEWEVLEGLKDGQRFERRPEVFNGYLHKKRKWPLKGWHKRFFVIDGGILVYARSPGDVSRGRLHGSVDVGLSVISAKARRRRIDIDADEFIYHLRAKTPDVFRTWLNVLKVHRLYRQHLLTFGARESAPKIHPPLDELPPTENTSRVSSSSFQTYSTEGSRLLKIEKKQVQQDESYAINTINGKNCNQTSNLPKENLVHDWKFFENTDFDSDLIPLNFEPIEEEIAVIKPEAHTHSMCSMKCMARLYEKDLEELKNSPNDSTRATETEKQVDIAELDRNSLKTNDPFVNSSVFAYSFNSVDCDREINRVINNNISKTPPFPERNEPYRIPESSQIESVFFKKKAEPTTTLFLFARKKHRRPPKSSEHNMKRSRKSTNLVKYRNVTDEPCLKVPPSNCILQKRNRIRLSDHMVEIDKKINAEVQVAVINEDKSSQDVMSASEYDELAAKLVTKIFNERSVLRQNANRIYDVQYYVHQMVKELYDVKINQAQTHPVKVLFKSLLEFWLKNTKEVSISCAVKRVKSIDVQSSEYFTKDQNLSGIIVERATKDTQYYAYEAGLAFETKMIDKKRQGGPMRPATNSFIKERRIQELERILKSTVYTCDTVCGGGRSVEKDIAITKKLIDNLDSMQKCDVPTSNEETQDNSNPSSEFPVIQQTFNNFSKETAIPTDIMKEFLGAYLEVLINNSSSPDDNTTSTNDTKTSTESPKCDVESESVQNKLSKGISTNNSKEIANGQDSEQKCLKDLLEKVTKMFSKFSKSDYNKNNIDKQVQPDDTKVEGSFKADIVRNELPDKNIISENKDENSIVIDLTKFDLERISLLSDPTLKGMMSISIKLKERPPNIGESRHKKLNLKFSENTSNRIENQELILTSDSSGKTYQNNNFDTRISFKNPYTDYNPNIPKDDIGLRPYISSSDATSKAYRRIYESDHSLDVSMKNTSIYDSFHESKKAFDYHDDVQSCYILSSVKKSGMFSSSQIKKKVRVKESNEPIIGPSEQTSKEYAPKVIDEKFILLLLENLTLLSQNIPEIHKEINSLYEKLKKKHGKDLKYTQKSLGLLGKIYQRHKENESNAATNYDVSMKEDKPIKITSSNAENGINTSENLFGLKNLVDRSTSVYLVVTEVKEFEMQTDREPRKRQRKSVSFVDENTSVCTDDLRNVENCHCLNVTAETDKKDVACCTPNWYKESGVGTTIKYLMNNEGSCQNFRIIPQSKAKFKYNVPNVRYVLNADKGKDDEKPTEEEIEKKLWANIRRDPVRDIHTDPDKRLNFFLKDKVVKRDFNVYQLFVSNKFQATLSSSMSSSNLELLKSDCSELKTIYRCTSDPSFCSGLLSPTAASFVAGTPGGRLASWILESGGSLENASRELGQAQLSVQQLQRLLEALELQQHHHDTDVFDKVSLEGASPSVKKDRRKFGLRKKKSSSKCASVELAPGTHHHVDGSTSHMALSALTAPPSPGGGASSMPNSAASLPIACAATRPQSLPGPNTENLMAGPASLSSLTPDHQLREDFTVLAKDLVNTLKGVVNTLVCERGRLRAAMDSAEGGAAGGGGPMLAALRTNLNSALQQNSELRSRLSRIHDASDLADISSVNNTDPAIRQFQQSLSYSSSCLSASEFFDAEEHDDQPQDILPNDEAGVIELDGDSSSEAGSLSSEEGSASSDNSDGAPSAEPITVRLKNGVSGSGSGSGEGGGSETGWSRRTRLPCPRPTPGGPSLWNLLYKNIGKDLSQISMPVTINEPLNMLQRLCEELEYSELLDMAANATGEMDRMSLVAAFAVSSYAASAHRAASKPFNPLLAETYECVRPDKGFRFLAEQVSHHPPVSACHAESARWSLWQEARIKTKFWGKSMEFQPAGRVHLRLLPQGDHYEWNKVTTCVHNLFGGQRWVDQYGDMIITCHGTDVTAKLNFIKASSWSSGRHEVRGAVYGSDGARLRLHGRWSEALYAGDPPSAKCLWRPGAMPPEHELYYGFTRFAMELNEIEPGMRDVLPHTDTRLRPDQRALEEGDVDTAERLKHQLEQAQRDRRRHSPEHTPCWFRKSMEGGEEVWVFTGEYWRARDAGFSSRSQTSPPPAIW